MTKETKNLLVGGALILGALALFSGTDGVEHPDPDNWGSDDEPEETGIFDAEWFIKDAEEQKVTEARPKASAIKAIAATAMTETFDSNKSKLCTDIFDIAEGSDDKTRELAIEELERIGKTMTFDSSKRGVNHYIRKLALG